MSDNASRERTEVETVILQLLAAHGPMTGTGLAHIVKRSEQRIVTILENLERHGDVVPVGENNAGLTRHRIAEHAADEVAVA
ncbi:hypothetical protein [Rhodococcus sp. SORGH_AS_0303]|uniref:hypothetical protein n=1 Tax=Rhodococcus sp. SORGH_AS_0303 TaxID=3041753 RepID=UPI00277FAB29|nr:hypothetical protein [Rhodococcus sp. SORGH_AS_0303]MDQ1202721.1 putative transcriptional regulator [Rhodococcus sp. SORGH_AS_0303]